MRVTVPVAGTRFTCTFNTDKKMETRGLVAVPRPSSAGGMDDVTDTTRPSAGATMAPGRDGGTRFGSRKKKKQNAPRHTPRKTSHSPTNRPITTSARQATMKGLPARCGGGNEFCTSMKNDIQQPALAPVYECFTFSGQHRGSVSGWPK